MTREDTQDRDCRSSNDKYQSLIESGRVSRKTLNKASPDFPPRFSPEMLSPKKLKEANAF